MLFFDCLSGDISQGFSKRFDNSLFLVGIFSWDISALPVALNQPVQIAKPVQQDQPIQLAQPVKASWFDAIEKNYLPYSIQVKASQSLFCLFQEYVISNFTVGYFIVHHCKGFLDKLVHKVCKVCIQCTCCLKETCCMLKPSTIYWLFLVRQGGQVNIEVVDYCQ